MSHKTNTCHVCGGNDGIHQYGTAKCPAYGREETREGVAQRWMDTVFEDSGERMLHDAAPDLLLAAKLSLNYIDRAKHMDTIISIEKAIKRAEGK